ncbi:hypothetical protein JTB14_036435 [Gonioctena quinquepunctata]|nr:hypothetical protein JTB14_036435 [Gonioctena quinquepunctata]
MPYREKLRNYVPCDENSDMTNVVMTPDQLQQLLAGMRKIVVGSTQQNPTTNSDANTKQDSSKSNNDHSNTSSNRLRPKCTFCKHFGYVQSEFRKFSASTEPHKHTTGPDTERENTSLTGPGTSSRPVQNSAIVYYGCNTPGYRNANCGTPLPNVTSENGCFEIRVKSLLEKEIIEECDSPYAAPTVLVTKEDGTFRMCVDYRRLNSVTVPDRYPLPRMDDLMHAATRTAFMSTLDLKSGYHQVSIRESDRDKTAFITPFGIFRFNRMAFGLRNAPATFQRLIDRFRSGLQDII